MPFTSYGPAALWSHLLDCLIQIAIGSSYLLLNSANISIYFGFFIYVDAFCRDFCNIFDRIDERIRLEQRGKEYEVRRMLLDAYKLQTVIIE